MTVFAAVWHAEVVAYRVGEPFGTLVLALAATVIEMALIVSIASGDPGNDPPNTSTTSVSANQGRCLLVAGGVLSPGLAPRPHATRLEMSDAAPFIAPALLVAYLAIGGLLFWRRAARR